MLLKLQQILSMVNDNTNGNGNGAKRVVGVPFTKDDPRRYKGSRKGKKLLPALLKKKAEEMAKDDKEGRTRNEIIADILFQKAQNGDLTAIQLLYDRMEGRPRQAIEIANEDADIAAMDDETLTAYFLEQSSN